MNSMCIKIIIASLALFSAFVLALSLTAQEPDVVENSEGVKFLPNYPGTWKVSVSTYALDKEKIKTADQKRQVQEFITKMKALAEVLHQSPVAMQPRGVDFDVEIGVRDVRPECVVGDLTVSVIFWFKDSDNGQAARKSTSPGGVYFYVNDLRMTLYDDWILQGSQDGGLPDLKGRIIYYAPKPCDWKRFGFSVYPTADHSNEYMILTKTKTPYWLPMPAGEFLDALIADNKKRMKDIAGYVPQKSPSQEFAEGAAERKKNREESYAALLKVDPKTAATVKKSLEDAEIATMKEMKEMDKQWEESKKDKQVSNKFLERETTLQKELASMSPAKKSAQAWYLKSDEFIESGSGLVAPKTDAASPLIVMNDRFFANEGSPPSLRIIAMYAGWEGSYDDPYNVPVSRHLGVSRMSQFLKSIDWQKVTALLSD